MQFNKLLAVFLGAGMLAACSSKQEIKEPAVSADQAFQELEKSTAKPFGKIPLRLDVSWGNGVVPARFQSGYSQELEGALNAASFPFDNTVTGFTVSSQAETYVVKVQVFEAAIMTEGEAIPKHQLGQFGSTSTDRCHFMAHLYSQVELLKDGRSIYRTLAHGFASEDAEQAGKCKPGDAVTASLLKQSYSVSAKTLANQLLAFDAKHRLHTL